MPSLGAGLERCGARRHTGGECDGGENQNRFLRITENGTNFGCEIRRPMRISLTTHSF